MQAVDELPLSKRDLAFRCATLKADRTFKAIVAVMKAATLEKWANEQDEKKREDLWHNLQATQRLVNTVDAFAADAELMKRKEKIEAAKKELKRRRRGS